MKMNDTNLDCDVPSALVSWMADFVLDGAVLVDEQMKIRIASPSIEEKFREDYSGMMFEFNRKYPVTLEQVAQAHQMAQAHLAKAMATGPPYPTVLGKDYFEMMFGLNREDPAQREKINRTPLAKAMATGKVEKDCPPYPIVKAKNGTAYQILTWVAECADGTRMVLEFWRCLGYPWEMFKDKPGALSLKG